MDNHVANTFSGDASEMKQWACGLLNNNGGEIFWKHPPSSTGETVSLHFFQCDPMLNLPGYVGPITNNMDNFSCQVTSQVNEGCYLLPRVRTVSNWAFRADYGCGQHSNLMRFH